MPKYVERVQIVFNRDGTVKGVSQEEITYDPSDEFPDKQHPPIAITEAEAKKIFGNKGALVSQIAELRVENRMLRMQLGQQGMV